MSLPDRTPPRTHSQVENPFDRQRYDMPEGDMRFLDMHGHAAWHFQQNVAMIRQRAAAASPPCGRRWSRVAPNSAARFCESADEPPLPHSISLPPDRKQAAIISAAFMVSPLQRAAVSRFTSPEVNRMSAMESAVNAAISACCWTRDGNLTRHGARLTGESATAIHGYHRSEGTSRTPG